MIKFRINGWGSFQEPTWQFWVILSYGTNGSKSSNVLEWIWHVLSLCNPKLHTNARSTRGQFHLNRFFSSKVAFWLSAWLGSSPGLNFFLTTSSTTKPHSNFYEMDPFLASYFSFPCGPSSSQVGCFKKFYDRLHTFSRNTLLVMDYMCEWTLYKHLTCVFLPLVELLLKQLQINCSNFPPLG